MNAGLGFGGVFLMEDILHRPVLIYLVFLEIV